MECFRFRNSLRVENFSLFLEYRIEKREEEEEEERVKYSQYSIGICIVYLYSNLIIYTIAFPVSIDPWFEIPPP